VRHCTRTSTLSCASRKTSARCWPALKAVAIDPEAQRQLTEAARQNIALIRHLFACVKGYLGAGAEPGYTARW